MLNSLKNNKSLKEHIFKGNYRNLTGCHYFDAVDNVNVRFVDASKLEINSLGVIKGDIQMYQPKLNSKLEIIGYEWKLKLTGNEPQTFFPKNWSNDKILEESASAITSLVKKLAPKPDGSITYSRMYHAQSNSGVWIRWFEDANGNITSIFPEF